MSIESPPPQSEAGAFDRFAGAALIAFGILLATLSGLCSLAVGGSMIAGAISQSGRAGQAGEMLMSGLQLLLLVGVFGGVPFGIGVGLIFAGQRLRRGPQPPR